MDCSLNTNGVIILIVCRFEVQIEVPPPRTVEQRIAILKVHCNSMVNNGRVLVKDAPAGTAAWNRLQVSMFFMHKMISFNVPRRLTSYTLNRNLHQKKVYQHMKSFWMSSLLNVMECQAPLWQE